MDKSILPVYGSQPVLSVNVSRQQKQNRLLCFALLCKSAFLGL